MSNAVMKNFEERHVIFSQGQVDPYLYKIMSGKVGLYVNYGKPDEKLVGITTAPNYIGTMNAVASTPSSYTAVTLTKSMLLQLPEAELTTFAKSDPGTAVGLMKTLAHRLTEEGEVLKLLLGEMKGLCGAIKPDRRAMLALIEQYEAVVNNETILDEYEEYVPAPEPEPEVTASPEMLKTAEDFYLPGHKGYPGITHPEYKQYTVPVDYTCPHCQNKFKGDKILASRLIPVRSEAEELRYDLRVAYRDFEAEWYEIVTCPYCLFSSFENYFREGKSLYKSRYEKNLARFLDTVYMDFSCERDLEFVFAQHYLALLCAPGFTDWRQINARVWMNLIRLYQDAGEPELADLAEKKTVDAYQTVYMECELQQGQEQRLCLTVAGMLYARGEKREARVWASKVRAGMTSGDRSAYWNMAEQLIHDVRAELEAENQ